MSCDIGLFLNESCESTSSSQLYQPDKAELELLELRTKFKEITSLCVKHKNMFLIQYENHQRVCCDPLSKHPAIKRKKNLRVITLNIVKQHKHVNLTPGKKLCTLCRKAILVNVSDMYPINLSDSADSAQPSSGEEFVDTSTDVALASKSFQSIGESPIRIKKLGQKRYAQEKVKSLRKSLFKKLKTDHSNLEDKDSEYQHLQKNKNEYEEMVQQLKETFQATNKRSIQMQVLTLLPQSWSKRRMETEFKISNYMARAAKKLVAEKGVLSTPNPKHGKTLSEETVNLVRSFYKSDEISREMPGMKDCVAVNIHGVKVSLQKRLILCNLKEAYSTFKEQHHSLKIGFSKFALLRPKNVVLPGASGTHSVCVCTIHQNVKLMMEGSKMSSLAAFRVLVSDDYTNIVTYKHLLAYLAGNPAQPDCYLGKCDLCGDGSQLEDCLIDIFHNLLIDEVTYKAWVTVDRTLLETLVKPVDDFIKTLVERLVILQRHDFIVKQQSTFMKEIKDGRGSSHYW